MVKIPINALPPQDWALPLDAPHLSTPFFPEAKRFGASSKEFDQGYDAHGQSRDMHRERDAGDPYGENTPIPRGGSQRTQTEMTDAPLGNKDTEASLQYEHHAFLRMQAKRAKMYKNDEQVAQEDKPETAGDEYKQWRGKQIKTYLAVNVDTHATDHSTIMTNGMHAEKALAYDVAIGCCEIPDREMLQARIAADWRFLERLAEDHPNKVFLEYFDVGQFMKVSTYKWANQTSGSEGRMPDKIINERKQRATQQPEDRQWKN